VLYHIDRRGRGSWRDGDGRRGGGRGRGEGRGGKDKESEGFRGLKAGCMRSADGSAPSEDAFSLSACQLPWQWNTRTQFPPVILLRFFRPPPTLDACYGTEKGRRTRIHHSGRRVCEFADGNLSDVMNVRQTISFSQKFLHTCPSSSARSVSPHRSLMLRPHPQQLSLHGIFTAVGITPRGSQKISNSD
jgi:hypothetical protein